MRLLGCLRVITAYLNSYFTLLYIYIYIKFLSLNCVLRFFSLYLALDFIFGWEQISDIYICNLNHRKSQNMCFFCFNDFSLHFQLNVSIVLCYVIIGKIFVPSDML